MQNSVRFFECLERRALRTAVYPTAYEQFAVELINRARADPTAEATRYAGTTSGNHTFSGDLNEGLSAGTISTAAKQPLAVDPTLTAAARAHSAWEVANSIFSHTGEGGSSFDARDRAAGYTGRPVGENIAINWASAAPDPTVTVASQHRDLFTDLTISDRGHRVNMMAPDANQIGVGIASGPYDYPGYGTLASFASTHDTAAADTSFLTGVAYADTLNRDHFYTPGEGLAGITVVATRVSDGRRFSTTTWSSGGYSLPLATGLYDVAGYGAGLGSAISYNRVAVDGQNVEKDFVAGTGGTTSGVATDFATLSGSDLAVNGTNGADRIAVTMSRAGDQIVVTMNGGSMAFAAASVARIDVAAGDGNDSVTVNANLIPCHLQGGLGKDTLVGGAGDDVIYGDGGHDYLVGNAGNDLIVGGNGNDVAYGGYGNDRLYGGVGNDSLDGGIGNDRVYAGPGDDTLAGGAGRDFLYGQAGADLINGGAHRDYADDDPLDTRIAVEVLIEA